VSIPALLKLYVALATVFGLRCFFVGSGLRDCVRSVLNGLMPGLVYVIEVYYKTSIDRIYESGLLRDFLRRFCGSDEVANTIFNIVSELVRERCLKS